MPGCPWQCRFCQSTALKRPVRYRRVESIIQAALETYRHTGYDEASLLSLSSSNYPRFTELVEGLNRSCTPLGISVSLPSRGFYERLGYVILEECSIDVGEGEKLDYWQAKKKLHKG